jgi:PilZ domain-containing protein
MATPTHSFARVLPFPGERRSAVYGFRPIPAERRLKFRYPFDLVVRFRSSSAGPRFSGTGQVVNLSSGGVLVASERQVTEGALVEMSIEWPSLLNGRVPLQLVATGRVLRLEASHFAATFERYQFRTMKSSSLASA